MQLETFAVHGLFGHINHHVRVRAPQPTLITGPNGTGKTHLMRIVSESLNFDFIPLLDEPFDRLEITFDGGERIEIDRIAKDDSFASLRMVFTGSEGNKEEPFIEIFDQDDVDSYQFEVRYLPWIRRTSFDQWFDERRMASLSIDNMRLRMGGIDDRHFRKIERLAELRETRKIPRAVFIDTKRLDTLSERSATNDSRQIRNETPVRIQEYMSRLEKEVSIARRQYLTASQRADMSLPKRLLEAAGARIYEADIRSRYDIVSKLQEELSANALSVREEKLPLPRKKMNPTEKRFLDVFIGDWEKRIQSLLPLHEKISALRAIIDRKLEPSGKQTSMSPKGELVIRSLGERRVDATKLSSGEQHLVAVFTQLMFNTGTTSVAFIDEPEISWHASWQHDFLQDVTVVSEIRRMSIIVATHSTAIINGKWNLTEELNLPKAGGNLPTIAVDSGVNESELDSEELDEF